MLALGVVAREGTEFEVAEEHLAAVAAEVAAVVAVAVAEQAVDAAVDSAVAAVAGVGAQRRKWPPL